MAFDSSRALQPRAIDEIESFGYEVRGVALRLVLSSLTRGPKHLHRFDVENAMARTDFTEVLDCLLRMGAAGFLEYYNGAADAAQETLIREIRLADALTDPSSEGS